MLVTGHCDPWLTRAAPIRGPETSIKGSWSDSEGTRLIITQNAQDWGWVEMQNRQGTKMMTIKIKHRTWEA